MWQPPVDIITKVLFWPGMPNFRLSQARTGQVCPGHLLPGDRVGVRAVLHDGLDDHRHRVHPQHSGHRHGTDLRRRRGQPPGRPRRHRSRQVSEPASSKLEIFKILHTRCPICSWTSVGLTFKFIMRFSTILPSCVCQISISTGIIGQAAEH